MNNDQPLTEPTPALRVPVTDRATAEAFITELRRLGLDYHFEDDAEDCLKGVCSMRDAHMIQGQVNACYEHWNATDPVNDCPIGFLLRLLKADEAAGLLARLAEKYPGHEFALQSKDSCGCTDYEDAPDMVITFTGPHQQCIVDPFTNGFYRCDPKAVYGIDRADATAIRAYNDICIA